MYYIGSLLAFVGAVWMTINAAKKDGVIAAILTFICTFYLIYYGIKNFAENKIPFLMVIAGIVLAIMFRPDLAAMTATPAAP